MFDLAQAAEVSVSTIKRIEYDETVSLSDNMRSAVRAAFEIAGITFIADDGRGVGLRFKADSDQHRRPAL